MTIEGKEYEVTEWNKPFLISLVKKTLGKVTKEKELLQTEARDDLSYAKRIRQLINEENDLKYYQDQLSGKPML